MNEKMDSGPFSYGIRTCFITKTSIPEAVYTDLELSVKQMLKNLFNSKLLFIQKPVN